MKHNKLLEVALTKTNKQTDALEEFLRRNQLPDDKPKVILDQDENDEKINNAQGHQLVKYDDNIILEEKSKQLENTQYDLENFPDMDMNDEETNIDVEDEQQHDKLILANLNIVKNNPIPVQYQVKEHVQFKEGNNNDNQLQDDANYMKKLPQTQSEVDELSIDSADYQIKEYIKDLFLKNRASKA